MKKTTEEQTLDDPALYERYDPAGMFARLGEMPAQCQRAWQLARGLELPEELARVNKVVILGMGGSAIGGDLLTSLVNSQARLPIIISREYDLPGFVDEETLVIASSYSGNTEETLTAFGQALKTEAKKLVITTGGKLKDLAGEKGITSFVFDYPTQPRAALPYGFLSLVAIMQKLGLIGIRPPDMAETVAVLKSLSAQINQKVPTPRNPAKQLAQNLHRRLPVIYGSGITAGVARRWKGQINENAKAWAFYEVFPELNHNSSAGYRLPAELAGKIVVVMLDSPLHSRPIKQRYQITSQLLKEAGVKCLQVELEGSDPLGQILSLVLLGDYASCYLAVLNKVDPTPVKAIEYLKEQLLLSS
ncbi:MAG: bifunctional phosphoglucose/phosphomannose isomerase [Chloroflexota bacterium]